LDDFNTNCLEKYVESEGLNTGRVPSSMEEKESVVKVSSSGKVLELENLVQGEK
jgi:hypothetical protein